MRRASDGPRRAAVGAWILLIALACGGELEGPAAPPEERPNLLVLMAEDMSPRVRAFGDPIAVTPNLDALAEGGVRFPNTFTTAGVCAPSRAAHITGLHQLAIGAQHMRTLSGGGYLAVPPAEVKAYPELLRRAGYYTFTGEKLDYQFSGVLSGSGPFTIWDEEGRGASWRGRADGQPFYGLVNFQSTHESALFPRSGWPRSGMHLVFRLLYAYELWGQVSVVSPEDVVLPPYYPDTPPLRRDLARHYDNIHFMDGQVGEILAQLEADGLADSTIVIWTTDHGDGLPRAKRELFDSGIRVPMIVHCPERFRPEGWVPGSVNEELVSFVDFAPTLLGLAGVERPDYLVGRRFIGGADVERELIFAAQDRVDDVVYRKRAARNRRFKYIRNDLPGQAGAQRVDFRDHLDSMRELWRLADSGELEGPARLWFEPQPAELLFDVRADPHEVRDLSADPEHAQTLAQLRAALDEWLGTLPEEMGVPEPEMAERFWPGSEQPVTPAPRIEVDVRSDDVPWVRLVSPEGEGAEAVSMSYRRSGGSGEGDGRWRIYVAPFEGEAGQRVEARSVRYGWVESETTRRDL
jgi:arylsulfatase A-like enzyme